MSFTPPVSVPCNQRDEYKNAQVTPKPIYERPMASDKKRKAGFKAEEMSNLIEEIERNQSIIFSRFKGAHTNKEKTKLWEEIAQKITAVSRVRRGGTDVRKKWQDFASLSKRKAAAVRASLSQTGGGPSSATPLTPEEDRAIQIMGVTSTDGITGGVDIRGGVLPTASTSRAHDPGPPVSPGSPVSPGPPRSPLVPRSPAFPWSPGLPCAADGGLKRTQVRDHLCLQPGSGGARNKKNQHLERNSTNPSGLSGQGCTFSGGGLGHQKGSPPN